MMCWRSARIILRSGTKKSLVRCKPPLGRRSERAVHFVGGIIAGIPNPVRFPYAKTRCAPQELPESPEEKVMARRTTLAASP
jgi:hypothetical protein